jgi:hypothetical protein
MKMLNSKWKSSKSHTLIRWLKSREQRIVELQSYPLYWKIKERGRHIKFFFQNLHFKLNWKRRETKEWRYSHFEIIKTILKPLLLALFFVFLFEGSERLFIQYKSNIKPYVPEKLIEIWNWLRHNIKIEISIYTSFLGTIASVSATFLGLYFTALSVLITSAYTQVTADIRSLLMRDKVGNSYIQVVALAGAYSTILLGLSITGYTPSLLSLILLVILGIAEIYSFINLGIRIFVFFDPATLVFYLRKDLVQWIKEATIKGSWWQDAPFQAHFQRQAENVLDTYRNLIFVVKGEEHLRSQSLIKLANAIISLLRFYENQKSFIPSQSKWFKPTYHHKDWITASHSETSIATQTGTTLHPKEVPDLLWLEKEIGKIIDFALKGFLEKQDLTNALYLFQSFLDISKYLARIYCVEEALLFFRIIKLNTQKHLEAFEVPNISKENDLDSLRFTLALADFYALCFINILLGFSEGVERLNLEFFEKFIKTTNWKDSRSIYREKFPRKVLQQLELNKRHLDFEKIVEGQTVTPIWYQLQLLILSYFRFLESSINSLLIGLEEIFLQATQALIKQEKHIIAIQLIERGFEACHKYENHFFSLQEYCQELDKARKLEDIPSVNFSWEDYQKRIEAIHDQLVILLSKSLYEIIQLPKLDDLPDYFGHAYTVLTDECFKAMAMGKEELFKILFPKVFDACLEAHARQKKLENFDTESKFVLVADPIVDLLHLSGYSIIFQELDGKNFFDIVQSTWDIYFADKEDRLLLIKLFVTFGTQNSFIMSPRSITRTSWQQYLGRILRKRELLNDDYTYGSFFDEEVEDAENHPSKIIRTLTRSIMLHEKANEVFLAIYFKKEIESKEVEFPDKVVSFYKDIYEDESE